MKKLTVLIIAVMLIVLSSVPVMAEGIYVNSKNGDLIRLFEDAAITEPAGGNVVTVLGNVSVNSKVNGHVIAIFGDVQVNSEVDGNVVSIFGNVILNEQAEIGGDVIALGLVEKARGAVIHGQEVRMFGKAMNLDMGAISYLRITIMMLFTLAVLITGLLMLLISKNRYSDISRNIEKNFGRKMVLGLLSFAGASSLLVILLITLIAPLFYIVLLIVSSVPASMFIGRMILKTFSPKNSIYVEFITGLTTTTLVKLAIIFLTPQQSMLPGIIAVGLLNFLIYSFGMGILMEQHYLKNNKKEQHA